MSGDGSTGGTTAQTTPTASNYTRSNFPYRQFADEFMNERSIDQGDRDEAWQMYVDAGSKWTPGASLTGVAPAQPMTIPAFMPGNASALAQQLALGYGQTPESYMQSPLAQLFQPMKLSAGFNPPKSSSNDDDDRRR